MKTFTDKTQFLAERYGIGMDSGDSLLIPAVDVQSTKGLSFDAAMQMAQDAPTNLLQSGLTNWCLMSSILAKLGVSTEGACGVSRS